MYLTCPATDRLRSVTRHCSCPCLVRVGQIILHHLTHGYAGIGADVSRSQITDMFRILIWYRAVLTMAGQKSLTDDIVQTSAGVGGMTHYSRQGYTGFSDR